MACLRDGRGLRGSGLVALGGRGLREATAVLRSLDLQLQGIGGAADGGAASRGGGEEEAEKEGELHGGRPRIVRCV